MSKRKIDINKILNRLVLFISIGLIGHIIFVLYTTEKNILVQLKQLSLPYILLILLLMLIPWFGYASRVTMWSAFLKEKLSFWQALRIVITSDVASALSPTAVGGAPIKAGLLINRGFSSGKVGFMLTLGVLEDIVFFSTGFIFATLSSTGLLSRIFIQLKDIMLSYRYIFFWIFFLIAVYIFSRKTKIYPQKWRFLNLIPFKYKFVYLRFLVKSMHSYGELKECFMYVINAGKLRLLASISILFIQWFSKLTILIVILSALKIDFDALQIYARQWMIWITMLFIPTPGASGGAEASFLLIFGKSIPEDIVNLIVSLWRFFTYYLILFTAVIIYQTLTYLSRKNTQKSIEVEDSNLTEK